MPLQHGALPIDERLHNLEGQLVEPGSLHVDRLRQHGLRRERHLLLVIHLTVVVAQDDADLLLRGGKDLEFNRIMTHFTDIEHQILRSLLHYPELTIRHKVLGEHLFLVWHQPCEVGLVLGIDTCHEFDVGAETLTVDAPTLHLLGSGLIGQVAVPGAAEVAVSPGPLLLAGREVVAGHMQHAAAGVVFVATLEVKARVDAHIRRRHVDVLVVRDVDTCRIVHLVVSARGDGERRDGTLAMVEHGVDVGREHALVLIVHLHGGVGPPEEGLRHVGAVV